MTQWYYAEGNRQRQGPLSTESLVALFRSSRIGLDTLVWRDGQGEWQPLSHFVEELGLISGARMPPPLPTASPMPFAPSRVPAAAPKSALSGCMIALIVVAVVAIPVVGILAAIALPAYQDYTLRAKVAGALPLAAPLKAALTEHVLQHSACPDNDEVGFGAPESYAAGNVASATIGVFESDRCGIELILAGTGSDKLDGKAIWLEYDPSASSWQCSSEIDDRYLPVQCRD
jgi:type IV pilus assembly protein PilA